MLKSPRLLISEAIAVIVDNFLTMELKIFVQLIFLSVFNILIACAGIALNTMVVVSFLLSPSSSPLRKKLCNFMIMVLSCVDLLVVITNHAVTVLRIIIWLNETQELLSKITLLVYLSLIFQGFSFLTILVMSAERYLAVYYPFFHLTSVTRRRLLLVLAALFMLPLIATILSVNKWTNTKLMETILLGLMFLPTIFLNYKLFTISRNLRRHNRGSTEGSISHANLKNISTCLLVFACFIVMSIPTIIFIVFMFIEERKSQNAQVLALWTMTVISSNSTMNCLIFFWKNKVLRKEAAKVLKTLKDRYFSCKSQADEN